MISRAEAIELVVRALPEFRQPLEAYRAEWEAEGSSLSGEYSKLGSFVLKQLESRPASDLRPVFEVAELLMNEGEPEVRDAVATCFLESLVNAGGGKAALFVPLLGEASRAFLREWDAFTGVKTPGL